MVSGPGHTGPKGISENTNAKDRNTFFKTYDRMQRSDRLDVVDSLIISSLSRNAKQSTFEIWDILRGFGHKISQEEIESRISILENKGIIKNYTIAVDPRKIPGRVTRVDLVRFRTSQALPRRLEGLKKYLRDAPFVVYSGRTRGSYDWITVKSFLSSDMADEESDIYRNLFGDILQTFEVYDFIPQTDISLHGLAYTETEYARFLKEWAPPFVGK